MGTIAQLPTQRTRQLDHAGTTIGLLGVLVAELAAGGRCADAALRAAVDDVVAVLPAHHPLAGIRLEGVGEPMLVRLAVALVAEVR